MRYINIFFKPLHRLFKGKNVYSCVHILNFYRKDIHSSLEKFYTIDYLNYISLFLQVPYKLNFKLFDGLITVAEDISVSNRKRFNKITGYELVFQYLIIN